MECSHRQLALADRQAHDADVELIRHHRSRDLRRVPGDDDQLRARITGSEPAQRRWQEIDAERGARAEPDPPGHDAPELLDELEAAVELLHGATGVSQQQLAGLGRVRPLADPLEQRQPDLALELAYLHADGRLGEPELPRRPREAPVARHRLQCVEMRQLHVHEGKKYLIVTIMTIDFTDARIYAIMRAMDMNHFVAEMIARERLEQARALTVRRRLLRGPRAMLTLTGS